MQENHPNLLGVLFTIALFVPIASILIILWIWGTNDPKPLMSELTVFLSAGFLYRSCMDYWHSLRMRIKGFKSKALGSLLAAIALFDAWLSHNSFGYLSIILLFLSALLLILSVWTQIAVLRAGKT